MMHHGPHMGHGPGMMTHQRSIQSIGGSAPFRPGDWKCGAENCNYHNFAKNVTCLRCGASRAQAAVVADSNYPGPMDNPGFGMGPPSMGGNPGQAGFANPASFGSAAGFPGQQFGGPPSTYALPSGLGAPGPYPPMGGQYGAANGGMHAAAGTGFDSRAAEAAFSAAGPAGSSGPGFANGGFDASSDPFSFLNSGLGNLNIGDDRGRNTTAGANSKSPGT